MTQWSTTTKHEPSSINGGRRYELRDRVSIEQLNNMTENSFYAMDAASEAKEKAEEALSFAQGSGTTVYENGKPVAEFNADKKANVEDIPTEYIKDAYVENDILTIQKANGLIISFQGGGGGSSYDDTEIKQSIQDLQTNKADKTELKDYVTNTALENKGYLTEIPSDYITETELEAKKYATISAVNTALANKANQSSMEKAQLDIQNLNSNKADKSEIPTTASQVNALPNTTKYGASIDLSMDSTTYVVTAQLKDQDGNNLGTAKTIDLPLESVVVSGSYDATNKKVILTLKDGSTIDFSVADLVNGLASSQDLELKVNTDASNLTNENVANWKAKLGYTTMEEVEAKKYATISSVNTALSSKANQSSLDKTNTDVERLSTRVGALESAGGGGSSLFPINAYLIQKTGTASPASIYGGTWTRIAENVVFPLGNTAPVKNSSGYSNSFQPNIYDNMNGTLSTASYPLTVSSGKLAVGGSILAGGTLNRYMALDADLSKASDAISGVDIWWREA